MQHLLAGALEAEMPGLDDPGVHRAHRHLVDLAALDLEELAHRRARAVIAAHRLQPGMTPRHQAVLLPDLTLEQMGLRRDAASATDTAAWPACCGPPPACCRRRRPAPPPVACPLASGTPNQAHSRAPRCELRRGGGDEVLDRRLRHLVPRAGRRRCPAGRTRSAAFMAWGRAR